MDGGNGGSCGDAAMRLLEFVAISEDKQDRFEACDCFVRSPVL